MDFGNGLLAVHSIRIGIVGNEFVLSNPLIPYFVNDFLQSMDYISQKLIAVTAVYLLQRIKPRMSECSVMALLAVSARMCK